MQKVRLYEGEAFFQGIEMSDWEVGMRPCIPVCTYEGAKIPTFAGGVFGAVSGAGVWKWFECINEVKDCKGNVPVCEPSEPDDTSIPISFSGILPDFSYKLVLKFDVSRCYAKLVKTDSGYCVWEGHNNGTEKLGELELETNVAFAREDLGVLCGCELSFGISKDGQLLQGSASAPDFFYANFPDALVYGMEISVSVKSFLPNCT